MKPTVLHVITVYNGRSFVPKAIQSAMQMDQDDASIDVLVLDDASPEPGWSEELARICKSMGAHYYRTPRNLGIPRNVSLGLATAVQKKYNYVTINNSDVIFPNNLISVMIESCKIKGVGSVTAWSNNVSIYSLDNVNPDIYLSNQETVDFVSSRLSEKYGNTLIDGPAGISFCIMMPVDVIRDVGVMDPVFGRGYCEETDWSLRSLAKGYRICISPSTFVYHQGRGSNLAAGLVSGAHTTVPENEAIIDLRYPEFRNQCAAFERSGIMPRLKAEAIDFLLNAAAKEFGYCIVQGWRPDDALKELPPVRAEIVPDGATPTLRYFYAGFSQEWRLEGTQSIQNIIKRFGSEGLRYNAFGLANGQMESVSPYPIAVW